MRKRSLPHPIWSREVSKNVSWEGHEAAPRDRKKAYSGSIASRAPAVSTSSRRMHRNLSVCSPHGDVLLAEMSKERNEDKSSSLSCHAPNIHPSQHPITNNLTHSQPVGFIEEGSIIGVPLASIREYTLMAVIQIAWAVEKWWGLCKNSWRASSKRCCCYTSSKPPKSKHGGARESTKISMMIMLARGVDGGWLACGSLGAASLRIFF